MYVITSVAGRVGVRSTNASADGGCLAAHPLGERRCRGAHVWQDVGYALGRGRLTICCWGQGPCKRRLCFLMNSKRQQQHVDSQENERQIIKRVHVHLDKYQILVVRTPPAAERVLGATVTAGAVRVVGCYPPSPVQHLAATLIQICHG